MPKPVASFSAKAATGVIFGGCQADFGVEKIDYIY